MDRETEAERWMVLGQEGVDMRLMDEFTDKQTGNELPNGVSVGTICCSGEGFENSFFTLTWMPRLHPAQTRRLDWITK